MWHALDGGAFVLWSTLAIGSSEWESLALPLVYRVSKHQLVLDRKLTTIAVHPTEPGDHDDARAMLAPPRPDRRGD